MEAAPPGDLGAALVGRTILYWWPDDGWQRGTVARLCPRGAFSCMVAYTQETSALHDTADTLLDAATYGSAGCFSHRPKLRVWPGPFGPGPPQLKFEFGRWLVTATDPGGEVNGQNVPACAAFSVVAEESSFSPQGVYLRLES